MEDLVDVKIVDDNLVITGVNCLTGEYITHTFRSWDITGVSIDTRGVTDTRTCRPELIKNRPLIGNHLGTSVEIQIGVYFDADDAYTAEYGIK